MYTGSRLQRVLVRTKLLGIDVNLVLSKCFYWIQWQKILYFKKTIQTYHLLCKRPRCYHSANKTQVAERILILNPIHTSVIYQIPRVHWISDPFREDAIDLGSKNLNFIVWFGKSRCPTIIEKNEVSPKPIAMQKKKILTFILLWSRGFLDLITSLFWQMLEKKNSRLGLEENYVCRGRGGFPGLMFRLATRFQ